MLELAGTDPGSDYDKVVVTGGLTAGGTLDVQLLNGFSPNWGDTFDLLDFNSLSGGFASIHLPTLNHGLFFDASSLLTTGTLTVVPEPATLGLIVVGGLLLRRRHSHSYTVAPTQHGLMFRRQS